MNSSDHSVEAFRYAFEREYGTDPGQDEDFVVYRGIRVTYSSRGDSAHTHGPDVISDISGDGYWQGPDDDVTWERAEWRLFCPTCNNVLDTTDAGVKFVGKGYVRWTGLICGCCGHSHTIEAVRGSLYAQK
jgi:hypothetical protein